MILRTTWILLAALLWLAPAQAQAESDFTTPVITRLESEGFSVTQIKRTWLGRILIIAINEASLREIVLNRHNGEVLRDRLFARDHTGPPSTSPSTSPSAQPSTPAMPDGADEGMGGQDMRGGGAMGGGIGGGMGGDGMGGMRP